MIEPQLEIRIRISKFSSGSLPFQRSFLRESFFLYLSLEIFLQTNRVYAKRELLVAVETNDGPHDLAAIVTACSEKCCTWVSRRRVTAPLGAALCDDLRRYYAQNNKVDSAYLYVQRRMYDRTHTRFTLSLREIAKLTGLLSNQSLDWILNLWLAAPPTGIQPWLIAAYFSSKYFIDTGRSVFASW